MATSDSPPKKQLIAGFQISPQPDSIQTPKLSNRVQQLRNCLGFNDVGTPKSSSPKPLITGFSISTQEIAPVMKNPSKEKLEVRKPQRKRKLGGGDLELCSSKPIFKDRHVTIDGKSRRIRLPAQAAATVFQLTKELGHKSDGETVEWLLKQAGSSVDAVLNRGSVVTNNVGEVNNGGEEMNNGSTIVFRNLDSLQSWRDFERDQIWALKDDFDGMPRLYARINEPLPDELEVEVTLLVPVAMSEEDMQWLVEKNLPKACGTFREAINVVRKGALSFSYLVDYEEGLGSVYRIFPRKGEIWAVYKDWDVNWTYSDVKDHAEFKIVEVLSDFSEVSGVFVVDLLRVEGVFVSVFSRSLHGGVGLFQQISEKELLSFSHRIPASQFIGEEMNGVPDCSWKLETEMLPPRL